MSILDNHDLNRLAREKQKADAAYDKAFRRYTAEHDELLPVKRFWDIVEYLRTQIMYAGRDSNYYCDELFRQCICDTLEVSGKKVTFDELIKFCNNWDAVVSELHRTLFEVIEDKGDDGYGDLCDNLPLVGRAGVKKLLGFTPENHANGDVKTVIAEAVPQCKRRPEFAKDKWLQFVWNGENYWSMSLSNEAQRRYVRQACDHKPKPSKRPTKVSLV